MTAYETITSALTGHGCRRSGSSSYQCPSHEDREPSLSVNQASEFAGAVMNCFAGCDTKDVLSSLGLTSNDLFDETPEKKPETRFDYRSAAGEILYTKIRYCDIHGERKFRFERPGGISGIGDQPRVLFNLPELVKAVAAREEVYVVEGETDVLALAAAGIIATTSHASEWWKPEQSAYFRNADVVIVADKDATGIKTAELRRSGIASEAASVRVAMTPLAHKGADIRDHLNAGMGLDELISDDPIPMHLTAEALAVTANPLLNADGSVNFFAAWDAAKEGTDWLVRPFLVKAMTHSLWGTPGHGKSLFALETIVNHVIPESHVLYVDNENHLLNVIIPRLKSFGMTPQQVAPYLHLYSFSQIPPLDTAEGGRELLRLAQEHSAELVVVDTFSRFIEGPEDKSDTFKDFYRHTLMLLKRNDIASLRLDHPGKDTSRGTRGSSAKYGDIDFEFQIEDPQDGKTAFRKLTTKKSRTGDPELGSVTMLRKHDGEKFWHEWIPEKNVVQTRVSDDAQVISELGVTSRRAIQDGLAGRGIKMGVTRIETARRELGFVSESVSGSN